MRTIKRRDFLKAAAFACPAFAAGADALLAAQQRQQEVKGLAVIKAKCTGCGDCVKNCPVEAIKLKDGLAVIDNEECLDCGACIDECPTEAIVHKKDLPAAEAEAKPPARKEEPANKANRRTAAAKAGDEISYAMPGGWIAQALTGSGPEVKAHYVYYVQSLPYGEMYLSYHPLADGSTLDRAFDQGLANVRPSLPYYQARGTQKTAVNGLPAIVHDFSYMPGGAGVLFFSRTYTLLAGAGIYTFFFQTVQRYA